MIVDGKAIAKDILERTRKDIQNLHKEVEMSVIIVGQNPVTEHFVKLKKKRAESIGIRVNILRFPEDISEAALIDAVMSEAKEDTSIIVQLPLPKHLNTNHILSSIPSEKDPDILSEGARKKFEDGTLSIVPPVVGAIAEIIKKYNVAVRGKQVLIVGQGALVGKPAALWFRNEGGTVTILGKGDTHLKESSEKADIILLGAGVPNLMQPEMLKDSVILLDAGTSESGGDIVGDASALCEPKCSLFASVPGGIGPITIAVLLRNVVTLARP